MGIMNKPQVKAGGKVVVADFRQINPENFQILYKGYSQKKLRKGSMLISDHGELFIDSKMRGMEKNAIAYISDIYAVLADSEAEGIEGLMKMYGTKYPQIKTVDDWISVKDSLGDGEATRLLAALIAPMELSRREVVKIHCKLFG